MPSVATFASDGSRYVAWQTRLGGGVIVEDTASHTRYEVAVPTGCNLAGEESLGVAASVAAGGRFLLSCEEGIAFSVLDVRSRVVTKLPVEAANAGWARLGALYAEGYTPLEKCSHSALERELYEGGCATLYSLSSGAVSYRGHLQVSDLDKPGAPEECGRLRRIGVLRARDQLIAFSDGALAQPVGRSSLSIERCRGRASTLRAPGGVSHLSLAGGVLSWDNGLDAISGEVARQGKTLSAYRLSNRSRRSWRLPSLPVSGQLEPTPAGPYGYSTHTAHMIFWIASRALAGGRIQVVDRATVYAASF